MTSNSSMFFSDMAHWGTATLFCIFMRELSLWTFCIFIREQLLHSGKFESQTNFLCGSDRPTASKEKHRGVVYSKCFFENSNMMFCARSSTPVSLLLFYLYLGPEACHENTYVIQPCTFVCIQYIRISMRMLQYIHTCTTVTQLYWINLKFLN